MNLEEAIKTSIEYENKVKACYDDALEQCTDKVAKKLFRLLAIEEQGHVDYLERRLEEWQSTGKITVDKLATTIPDGDKIDTSLTTVEEKLQGAAKPNEAEINLLTKALEAEQTTAAFYKKMVGEMDNEGKRLFERFVEIEEGHLAIVQAEMSAVSGFGTWFDMKEFDLSGGA
jgi:rubrerythrin